VVGGTAGRNGGKARAKGVLPERGTYENREDSMRGIRLGLVVFAAALLALALGGVAYAFHSGGVAECGGCHSMHSPAPGGSYLLAKTDQSSTCLNCHAANDTAASSYHVMTYPVPAAGVAPVERTPGGDFAWLLKSYTFTVRGSTTNELGETHGHNTVAADYGIAVDAVNTTAPGGTFPSAQLSCVSCHDPHGKYRRNSTGQIVTSGVPISGSGSYTNSRGNTATNPIPANLAVGAYRLLAGLGYTKGGVTYTGVPAAVVPSTYNQSEATNQVRTAYGHATTNGHVAWGTWCATCHTGMHSSGNYVHPVDENLGGDIASIYNAYVNSSNTAGGSATSSFLSLVPFVEGSADYTLLGSHASNTNGYLNGPVAGDRVSCVSCHRAHASGWEFGLRWNMEGEFITVADATGNAIYPGTDNGAPVQFARGRTAAETQAAYYDRPVSVFGPYQRVLCNKCHAKD